jgi:hypothetical protein
MRETSVVETNPIYRIGIFTNPAAVTGVSNPQRKTSLDVTD